MNYLHRSVIANRDINTIAHIIKKKFVEKDILVNCPNSENHGKSALYLAAQYGRSDIVDLLITEYATCNVNDKFINPMVVAANHGQLETVKRLLFKNPKLIYGETGNSAFLLANQYGHLEVVSYLLEERIKANLDNAKAELQQLHSSLFTQLWENKGWGFFSDGIPNGIGKLQTVMIKNGLERKIIIIFPL